MWHNRRSSLAGAVLLQGSLVKRPSVDVERGDKFRARDGCRSERRRGRQVLRDADLPVLQNRVGERPELVAHPVGGDCQSTDLQTVGSKHEFAGLGARHQRQRNRDAEPEQRQLGSDDDRGVFQRELDDVDLRDARLDQRRVRP